jgi:photosystem II stability/assembly factor-like uncharacterized protein
VFIASVPSITGTVSVTSNLPSATFNISGPASFTSSGKSATFTNAPTGTYTIAFGAIPGYITPPSQTQVLASGGTVQFSGVYVLPSLVASPASLNFTYRVGQGRSSASQSLSLSANAGTLNFTASASTVPPGGNWLSVTSVGGSTPATLTIAVAQNLGPGTYRGNLTVAALGAANSPLVIPVDLTVTIPIGAGLSITHVSPVSGIQGQTIADFQVVGTGFQPGATLSFGGAGISVSSISSLSPGRIDASVSIADNATLRAQDVIVTNQSLQQARLNSGFTVAPLVWNKLNGPWSSACDSSFGAIAVDPKNQKVIYLGSSHLTQGCGLYKSTDGGQSWQAIDTGLPQVGAFSQHYPAISKIVVSPSNPRILYIGTFVDTGIVGLRGQVFVSSNSGSSWSDASGTVIDLVGDHQIHNAVLDLAIDPTSASRVYVSVVGAGIFTSSDSGSHWQNIRAGTVAAGATDYYAVVRISSFDPSVIYSSGFTSYSVTIIPCDLDQNCIDLNGILPLLPQRSTDRGADWQALKGPACGPLTCPDVSDIAVDPRDSNVIYASTLAYLDPTGLFTVSNKGIFKSMDGGMTWAGINDPSRTNLSQFPIFHLVIDPLVPSTLYAVAGFSSIFRTLDGGASWSTVSATGLPVSTFVAAIAKGNGTTYALTSGGVYVAPL